jgi:TatD DNase family protein
MFIDTHCHLNFKDFREDADEVIKRTLKGNVQFINIGSQYSTSQRAVEYADKYNKDGQGGVWAAVGIHPCHLFNSTEEGIEEIENFNYDKYLELAKNDRVVAIGEVGLDYHHFETANLQIGYKSTNTINEGNFKNSSLAYDSRAVREALVFEKYKKEVGESIELQKRVFKEFIRLANEVGKPLIIHGWNADKKDKELVGGVVAYEDILESIKNNPVKKKGVVHSFIGNYKMALRFIEEGFIIGLNGIITYSESYDKLIKKVGLENIIIETDAPYLTPNPLERYSRNEPLNVKLVAQKIADVLEIDITQVEKITTKNAKQLFKI